MDDIRIRTHKELSGVAEKYYGFTFRQWLFLVLTGIITVPTYLYLTPILGDEISSWIVIIMGLPLMLCGFLTLQGMTADRLLPFLKRHYLDFGKPLEYKTEKELLAEKEAKKGKKQKEESVQTIEKPKKPTRAERKQAKKDKKVLMKMEKEQKKEKARLEKQKELELKIERKKAKEKAKAMKWYGDLDANKKALIEERTMENSENALTKEDIENIVRLGEKAKGYLETIEKGVEEDVQKEGKERETEESKDRETEKAEETKTTEISE